MMCIELRIASQSRVFWLKSGQSVDEALESLSNSLVAVVKAIRTALPV
jgi:hypothetical protein